MRNNIMLHRFYLIILKRVFKNAIWSIDRVRYNNSVYLTFDDGPHPIITKWVVKQLEKYNAKATFFCVGKNVRRYPEVVELLINKGHTIGHHSWGHLHGWKTNDSNYIDDVVKGSNVVSSDLFRPPYGKLTWRQYCWLSKKYKFIMWSVLSKDYDQRKSPEYCVTRVLARVKAGDIIVFHDSEKAKENLYGALPKILEELNQRGFQFEVIK